MVCYEHSRSDETIQLDTQKLGRIEVVGRRITGDRPQRKRGAGWTFLHVCVDGHNRLAYTEYWPKKRPLHFQLVPDPGRRLD
jgi:hypothetical protein